MTRRLLRLMFARLRRRQLPLSLSVVLALSGATGVAAALAYACYRLLGSPTIKPEQQIPLSTMLDVVKIVFGAVAGIGGVVALVVAYRRQKVTERSHELAEQVAKDTAHDATERRVTELYSYAVEQLGHDKAAVRLGGLYSLERLAQAHPEHRQSVVDVVCAYLRMPFDSPTVDATTLEQSPPRESTTTSHSHVGNEPAGSKQELQVRLAAQRLLTRHVTVLPPKDSTRKSEKLPETYWQSMRIDLNGAALTDFDFSHCRPDGADFTKAQFDGITRFNGAQFNGTTEFTKAQFNGTARFGGAQFNGNAGFNGAQFNGEYAWFHGAQFRGTTGFERAQFSRFATFTKAQFNGNVTFNGAQFHGTTGFEEAQFHGTASFGTVQFNGSASFKGAQFGGRNVGFDRSQFNGTTEFTKAEFRGTATFLRVHFGGKCTWFNVAQFHGEYAEFSMVQFSGEAWFAMVQFDGTAKFDGAQFDGAQFNGTAWFFKARFTQAGEFAGTTASYPNEKHVWPNPWYIEPLSSEEKMGRLVRPTDPDTNRATGT